MMPPMCQVCGFGLFDLPADKDISDAFSTVTFSDYVPLPDNDQITGHPEGVVWFCSRHLAAAQKLSHLTTREALRQLREQFPGESI